MVKCCVNAKTLLTTRCDYHWAVEPEPDKCTVHITDLVLIKGTALATPLGIRNISRIRKYLTEEATTHLIMAFVTSRLDCNNALLHTCHGTVTSKLQLVQNDAARVIAKKKRKKKHQSIEEERKLLHWLPAKHRIDYKIILTTYKCLNDLAPS